MKEFLTALGIIAIIIVLAIVYMGMDVAIAISYFGL